MVTQVNLVHTQLAGWDTDGVAVYQSVLDTGQVAWHTAGMLARHPTSIVRYSPDLKQVKFEDIRKLKNDEH